jgi:phosphoglucomutase
VRNGELKFDSNGKALSKVALAVNDPTSLRIDRIAHFFGASVFRGEVGEANIVGLARKLRSEGYLVRVFGEGSNGGIMIHPSAVRDPIDTLGAILKLLAIRGGEGPGGMGLFEIWSNLSGAIYRNDFTLADIMASIPPFVTTGVASKDATLKVKTTDHALLKDRYQKIFLREWAEKNTSLLGPFGISEWEAIAYNGMEEKRGIKRFADAGSGGLKIEFSGRGKKPAFIWMRGSGTEPVFRIVADAEGKDPGLERKLINWQRQMVLEADNAS